MSDRRLQENRIRFQVTAEHDTGNIISHQLLISFLTSLIRHAFHISVFHKSDNLQSGRIKMLKISCQLQCWTVDIRLCDLHMFHINLRCEIFQFHFFDNTG